MARSKRVKDPHPGQKYPDDLIIGAIEKAHGLISAAAKIIGCNPITIRKRMESTPAIAAAVKNARELMLDVAELKLFDAINQNRPWAICFYLKCIGKERGYVEKQQVEHSGKIEQKLYSVGTPVDEV